MLLQKFGIGDGISLSSVHTDKFKSGLLSISVCMPLSTRDYLLCLLLGGVMRRGTKKYPSMAQINRRLDMLYAANVDIQSFIRGDVLIFSLSAEMLDARFSLDGTDIFGEVAATLADILLNPLGADAAYGEEIVEAEKQIVFDSLLSEANDTAVYSAARLKELLYRESKAFPTLKFLLESIKGVTQRELSEFHARLCTYPIRAFYVGGENGQKVASALERHFSPILKNSPVTFSCPAPRCALPLCDVTEDRAVSQGKLALGFRTGVGLFDKQRPQAVLLNEIFGASPASKLFLGVRERLGLCYYCYSSLGGITGDMLVNAGIDVKNRDITHDAILASLEDIRQGRVSDFELSAAKKALSHSYTQLYDSPASLASFYFVRDLFGISESVEDCRASVMALSAEDVCAVAQSTVYDTCFFLRGTLAAEEGEDFDG